MNGQIYTAMLNTIVNAQPSVLVTLDAAGTISHIYMTERSQASLAFLIGKNFAKLLRLIFGLKTTELLCHTINTCRLSQQQTTISQLKHITGKHLIEYFNCSFAPAPEQQVVVLFQKVTENVLFQEEFCSIAEQHETLNQDLCIAMANLDFQLMDLEQAHKKLSALYRITSIVQKTVNEKEVLEEIVVGITRELGFANAAIFLLDPTSQELVNKAHRGYYNDQVRIVVGQGIIGNAALSRELIYVPNTKLEPRYIPGTSNGFSEVAIPLIVGDQVIGVLDVEASEDHILKEYDLNLLRSLASQIAMTIAHASHVTKACVEASTDGLTNVYNYRHFRNIFNQEFKRATRYQRPLSLLMIDIDHFKHYNDLNGHLQGDDALKAVADLIRQHCRDTDFVFRYGGEEFVVLLPETIVTQAHIIAERIRQEIAGYPFQNGKAQPGGALTVSIGIAGYPNDAYSEMELIACADAALYSVKRADRNRSCLYSDQP